VSSSATNPLDVRSYFTACLRLASILEKNNKALSWGFDRNISNCILW